MKVPPNIDAFLITNPTNIRYLTGFAGVDPRDAYVLVTKNKTYFFTNSLYMEQAKDLSPILLTHEHPISKALADLKIKKLSFEENNLTVAEFNTLAKLFTLVPVTNRIEQMRQIKRADEISNIRLAVNLTDQCFKFISKRLRPGITESRLALEIEGFLRARGADIAFAPIVAYNEHSSQPHYLKRGYLPLRRGSLVLLDFGAKVHGYCADMTRVIFIGPPKADWKYAYETVLRAQQNAIDLLNTGTRNGATLDAAAKEVIAEADLPLYPHSLGHNIGLDVHEGPRLTDKKTEILKPGMIFSLEPGTYIEGKYGIRIEDLIRLTDTGTEVMTKSPKELRVL